MVERHWVTSGEWLWQWWQAARAAAIAHQVPPEEADWLLQQLTDVDRLALRLASFRARPEISLSLPPEQLEALWQRRLQERVPVQYLAAIAPWRNFLLTVSPAVLIPRPETELIIDLVVAAVGNTPLASGDWADLGTGSGAIALGLAEALPNATIHAVDLSAEALAIAQFNAAQTGLSDRIHFYQGNWFAPLASLKGRLSGMVSNPPYIPTVQVGSLQPEVTRHEPHLALDGGADGLDCIRHLVATAPEYLQPGGLWLVELMAGQAIAVAELLQQNGRYEAIQSHRDLAGIERFVMARVR